MLDEFDPGDELTSVPVGMKLTAIDIQVAEGGFVINANYNNYSSDKTFVVTDGEDLLRKIRDILQLGV